MMRKEEKTEIITNNGLHEGDTGSPEVQIAILTRRINDLTENVTAGKALSAEEDELLHRYIRELTADLASFGVPDKRNQRKD